MQKENAETWSVALDGIDYPARTLFLPDWGWSSVSVESLNDKVMDGEGGDFSSSEAEYVDEQFLFYVPDNMICWPEDRLVSYLQKELA